MPKEKDIAKKIRKLIEDRGGLVYKNYGSIYSVSGLPDFFCCYHGLFLALEIKAPGKVPTECQLARIKQINDAGGYAIWTDNIEKVEEWLKGVNKENIIKIKNLKKTL